MMPFHKVISSIKKTLNFFKKLLEKFVCSVKKAIVSSKYFSKLVRH